LSSINKNSNQSQNDIKDGNIESIKISSLLFKEQSPVNKNYNDRKTEKVEKVEEEEKEENEKNSEKSDLLAVPRTNKINDFPSYDIININPVKKRNFENVTFEKNTVDIVNERLVVDNKLNMDHVQLTNKKLDKICSVLKHESSNLAENNQNVLNNSSLNKKKYLRLKFAQNYRKFKHNHFFKIPETKLVFSPSRKSYISDWTKISPEKINFRGNIFLILKR